MATRKVIVLFSQVSSSRGHAICLVMRLATANYPEFPESLLYWRDEQITPTSRRASIPDGMGPDHDSASPR